VDGGVAALVLGVANRQEAVAKAIAEGLMDNCRLNRRS